MICKLIAYALVVGCGIGLAARCAEWACRLVGRPARWVWLGALGMTIALVAQAPLRSRGGQRPDEATPVPGSVRSPASRRTGTGPPALSEMLARVTSLPVRAAFGATGRIPERAAPWLGAAWAAMSALVLLVIVAAHARVARDGRDWTPATVRDAGVRVAPSAGPAVVGLTNPAIVVPRWLLGRSATEQGLVIAHETQHLRARDPLLLAAGGVLTALLPWHPVVWWMHARLRLCVEVDCDQRVLAAGANLRAYGDLLIDLAQHCTGFHMGEPALAGAPRQLERRLLAMTTIRSRAARAAGSGLAIVALATLIAACGAQLPTADDIQHMDAASAQQHAAANRLIDSTVAFYVNDARVGADSAHAIPADRIATIDVHRAQGPGEHGEIRIQLKGTTQVAAGTEPSAGSRSARFAGIIFVDGTRVDRAALTALAPSRIATVDVLKGERATALYPDDPAAANGVIRITTRHAAP